MKFEWYHGPRASQELPNKLTTGIPTRDTLTAFYSPCGGYIACSDINGAIRIFSSDTREKLTEKTLHSGPVRCLKWSGCSRYLLSGGEDGTCMIWDLWSPSRLPTRKIRFGIPVVAVDLNLNCASGQNSDTGPYFLIAVALLHSKPRVCDLTNADEPRTLELPVSGLCSSVHFLPCFTKVILTSSRGKVYVYDLCNPNAKPVVERLSEGSICSALMSFDQSWLALNSASGTISVWAYPPELVGAADDPTRVLDSKSWPASILTPKNEIATTALDRKAAKLEEFHKRNNMRGGHWVNRELIRETNLRANLRTAKTGFEYFGANTGPAGPELLEDLPKERQKFRIVSKQFRLVSDIKHPWGLQPAESITFSKTSQCLLALSLRDRRTICGWDVVYHDQVAMYKWATEELQSISCCPSSVGLIVCGSQSGFIYEFRLVHPLQFKGIENMFEELDGNVELPNFDHLYETTRYTATATRPSVKLRIRPHVRIDGDPPDRPIHSALRPQYVGPTAARLAEEVINAKVVFKRRDLVLAKTNIPGTQDHDNSAQDYDNSAQGDNPRVPDAVPHVQNLHT